MVTYFSSGFGVLLISKTGYFLACKRRNLALMQKLSFIAKPFPKTIYYC